MKAITRIEQCLAMALASAEDPSCPPKLAGAVRHAVFPGGARVRHRRSRKRSRGLCEGLLRGGDWARARAGNLRVKLAVGDVVPCATRAAHEESPGGAAEADPEVGQPEAAIRQGGKAKAPPARQKQKPRSDRPVGAAKA